MIKGLIKVHSVNYWTFSLIVDSMLVDVVPSSLLSRRVKRQIYFTFPSGVKSLVASGLTSTENKQPGRISLEHYSNS